jgi:hypothetical protein
MTTGYNIREGSTMIAERLDSTVFFAVVDATDEVYAIRPTLDQAQEMALAAIEHLDEAASCGHPAAGSWVRARRPIRVVPMSADERAAALEDGTPVLDREPS